MNYKKNILLFAVNAVIFTVLYVAYNLHSVKSEPSLLGLQYNDPKLCNIKYYWGKDGQFLINSFGFPHEVIRNNSKIETWIYENQRKTTKFGPQSIIFRLENGRVTFGMFQAKL